MVVSREGLDTDQITVLALAAAHGDSAALEEWVRATQTDVWRFIAHRIGTAIADDLTQETYARAVTALPRFAGRASSRTWLLAIARHTVIDHIRAKSVRPQLSSRSWENAAENAFSRLRAGSAGFEELIEFGMLLDNLDADRREALILTQLLGYSYAEAADVCGCPVGTVRSRVARAREDLLLATNLAS